MGSRWQEPELRRRQREWSWPLGDPRGASMPFSAPCAVQVLRTVSVHYSSATEVEHMAASGKRMRVLRKPEHRGSVTFTIGISEDDLRVIARHGYEGAAGPTPVSGGKR